LRKLFAGVESDKAERKARVYEPYMHYGYTLGQIESQLDLHYSTISEVIQRQQVKRRKSKAKT
jgi:hypothetical protein